MRFALLGDHPDGLALARALSATGRHELTSYVGPLPTGNDSLPGIPRVFADLEEVLADPAIEALIVAGKPAERIAQLRRALQSERPVFCVHPLDDSPDAAYEASMIQADTRCRLIPMLPDSLHPAVQRLATLLGDPAALGQLRWLEIKRTAPVAVLEEFDGTVGKVWIPGWDVLRTLAGEIIEVAGFAELEELTASVPAVLAGRFEKGGAFHMSVLPIMAEARLTYWLQTANGTAELDFPGGRLDEAVLTWQTTEKREERWHNWNRWAALASASDADAAPSWQAAIRSLELDDAARRSVERRRSSTLEYQEASEAVGFKGTMTLVGCGLLWVIIFLAVASRWIPWMGWLIVPVLAVFLGLQFLRWIIPPGDESKPPLP